MDTDTNAENFDAMDLDVSGDLGDLSDMDIDIDHEWKDRGTLISASHICQFSLGEPRKTSFWGSFVYQDEKLDILNRKTSLSFISDHSWLKRIIIWCFIAY